MGGQVCSLCAEDEDYITTKTSAGMTKPPLHENSVTISPCAFVQDNASVIEDNYQILEKIGEGLFYRI